MSCLSAFKINQKLGTGGFGSTYLSDRNSDGLKVCLKVVSLRNGLSEQEIEREATLLSEFNNEHIIRYYGSFAESGYFYIVMEYAAKGNLADMIDV